MTAESCFILIEPKNQYTYIIKTLSCSSHQNEFNGKLKSREALLFPDMVENHPL